MSESPKLLRRLPQQGQIVGVCAGMAEYISIDVTLVRVFFVILTLVTGGGFILVYILMAIIMPAANGKTASKGTDINRNIQALAEDVRTDEKQTRLRNLVGLGLILLGAWLFVGQLFPNLIDMSWDYVWPIVLILLGVYIATRRA